MLNVEEGEEVSNFYYFCHIVFHNWIQSSAILCKFRADKDILGMSENRGETWKGNIWNSENCQAI